MIRFTFLGPDRRLEMVVTRSDRTVQQKQPLLISMTSSSTPTTSSASMLIAPNSLTMTAVSFIEAIERMWLRSVVFPDPRYPVRTVTGTLLFARRFIFGSPLWKLSRLPLFEQQNRARDSGQTTRTRGANC